MLRHAFVIALVGVLGILAAPPATASPGTDLTVKLKAVASFLLPSVHYEVSVTNNGPQALTSATVLVHLDSRVSGTFDEPPPCLLDTRTATLSCSFGPLATGATTSQTTWVVYNLPSATTKVTATAALAASNPVDTNPANDSAADECWYTNSYPGFPPYPYRMFC